MQNKFEQVLIRENQFLNNLNYNSLNNLSSATGNYMGLSNSQFYPSQNNTKINFNSTHKSNASFNPVKLDDDQIRKNINEQLDYVK